MPSVLSNVACPREVLFARLLPLRSVPARLEDKGTSEGTPIRVRAVKVPAWGDRLRRQRVDGADVPSSVHGLWTVVSQSSHVYLVAFRKALVKRTKVNRRIESVPKGER